MCTNNKTYLTHKVSLEKKIEFLHHTKHSRTQSIHSDHSIGYQLLSQLSSQAFANITVDWQVRAADTSYSLL